MGPAGCAAWYAFRVKEKHDDKFVTRRDPPIGLEQVEKTSKPACWRVANQLGYKDMKASTQPSMRIPNCTRIRGRKSSTCTAKFSLSPLRKDRLPGWA